MDRSTAFSHISGHSKEVHAPFGTRDSDLSPWLSNSSKDAYEAVVYILQLHRNGIVTTSLVISKARVAQLKSLTIPRAELTGAYLLAILLSYSAHILQITDINAWTDSAIVLCWLQKVPSSLNTFVGNRIGVI